MTGKEDAPGGVRFFADLWVRSFAWPRRDQSHEFDFRGVSELLASAEHDRIAFETARRLAALALRERAAIPKSLSDWIAGLVDGAIKPPKKRGQHPTKNFVRDLAIASKVSLVSRNEGIPPTRNAASGKRNSACDIVAAQNEMTFDAVAKIWDRYKHFCMKN